MKIAEDKNYKFYKHSGILIPQEYKDEKFFERIREFLKKRIKKYQTSDFTEYTFFSNTNNFMVVPRYLDISKYVSSFEIEDILPEPKKINFKLEMELRDEQKEIIEESIIKEKGVIIADTGIGKTNMAIYLIHHFGLKTIVIVPEVNLMKQWIERLKEFTNIKEEEIGILERKKFSEEIKKDIVLSTVQTLLSAINNYPEISIPLLNKSEIGMLISDESHTTTSAPKFSMSSLFIPAKHTFGLTATPLRHDGLNEIMKIHLGDYIKFDEFSSTMKSNVLFILGDFQIDTPRRKKYIYWGGEFQNSRYYNLLGKSKIMIDLLSNLINNSNRNLIMVSLRKNLIHSVFDNIKDEDKGKLIEKEGLDILNKRIVLATPKKIKQGIDKKEKDCLIMPMPTGNIKQMSGRVTRKMEGKKPPLIIDIVDISCKRIKNTSINRYKFYKENGWNINFSVLDNKNTLKKIDNQDGTSMLFN